MELREWAISILDATSFENKLFYPAILTDRNPGSPLLWDTPARPQGMELKKATQKNKLPPFHEHHNPEKRAHCLHRFLGHELLAVEMMAFALLAYPQAPKHFRKGLANILKEEQWHVKLYANHLQNMGVNVDDLPFYGHFWKHVSYFKTPLEYISVMHLTLEMANLDFAPHYGASFLRHGDIASSNLMKQILTDEIEHVSFGYHWFKKFKPEHEEDYNTWIKALNPTLSPKKARGFIFQNQPREQAGIPLNWINNLRNL